jgi:hypothetical protein
MYCNGLDNATAQKLCTGKSHTPTRDMLFHAPPYPQSLGMISRTPGRACRVMRGVWRRPRSTKARNRGPAGLGGSV